MREDRIYHAVSPDFVSRYDFALRVAATMGKDIGLIFKIKSFDLNLPAKRPNVFLKITKAEEKPGLKMVDLDASIKEVLRQAAESRGIEAAS